MGPIRLGKTQHPLTLGVPEEWLDRPEIVELREKGHTIVVVPKTDLSLAPWGHYMTEEMLESNLLEVALKRARQAAPKKGKK